MRLNLWTEIRTAAQVARSGKLSKAAKVLGMHHSSIIRHIDTLEADLGVKLFQRHARGYTPTEAGEELLRTASAVDDQFTRLVARIEHTRHEVSGRLVLTAVPSLDPLILPAIRRYLDEYPGVQITYSSDERPFELAQGEAHVALRAGPRPDDPDNVVSALFDFAHALYAAPGYVARHGLPTDPGDLDGHVFIAGEDRFMRAPFYQWLLPRVANEALVLRTPQSAVACRAVEEGIGIGFISPQLARPDLVRVFPDHPACMWQDPIWMVTHVDLHRSPKVQSLTRFLTEEARAWRTPHAMADGKGM